MIKRLTPERQPPFTNWLATWQTQRFRNPAFYLIPLTFTASVSSLLLLHFLVGMPLPYERTGIYLVPFATITVALSGYLCAKSCRHRILGRIGSLVIGSFLGLIVFQYLLELRVDRYEEWSFEAGTKRMLLYLKKIREARGGTERLGISWLFEPTISFYRTAYGWHWLEPVTKESPYTGTFDHYYLTDEDLEVVRSRNLKVLYTDPVSHTVLAEPGS